MSSPVKKVTKKSNKTAFICIENALRAAKLLGHEGVLIIPFTDGKPSGFMFNGMGNKNKIGIKEYLKSTGQL